ncbi:hypothetical protein HPB51_012353 [Rhipicephalus microplus]|uniref:SLED domain-containing protein n=1 Tax=Rhipicephalus microplus TaxID=6941 RepID=A0A9J6DG25_RHIMP|nr:hypothetical protein HPB51_012353 [Rhipicephalus microplus]
MTLIKAVQSRMFLNRNAKGCRMMLAETVPPIKLVTKNFKGLCVYVNHQCSCGPYLDPAKISQLPLQLGPGSMNRVLREAVQACVDCALNEKNVYNLLRKGNGKVIINEQDICYI